MGLLPIIFTALTIFTICIVAIFTISYIIYKLKSPAKYKVNQHIPIESLSLVAETNIPAYDFLQEFNEPVLIPEQKHFRPAPKPRVANRYEVLNGFSNLSGYQNEKTFSSSHRNSNDIFNNYSNFNSIDLTAVRLQK